MCSKRTAIQNLTACCIVGLLLSAASADAQEDGAEEMTMEEIEVIAKAQLDSLRLQLYNAEINVYDIFNELNDDNEFDVDCEDKAPVGSHIKQRFCQPRFIEDLYNEAFRERNSNRISKSQLRRKQEEMAEIMETLANDSPELMQALVDYSVAADTYDKAYDERCTGNVGFCSK